MLPSKRSIVSLSLVTLLAPLTACGNGAIGAAVQRALSPDPNTSRWSQNDAQVELPEDFPLELQYPNARLQESQVSQLSAGPASEPNAGRTTRWLTADPKEQVANFYQSVFQRTGWKVLEEANGDESTLVARRESLQVTVSVPNSKPPSVSRSPGTPLSPLPSEGNLSMTEFVIEYVRNAAVSTQPQVTETPQVSEPALSTSPSTSTPQFTDLSVAPPELRSHIEAVADLGVLQLRSASGSQSTLAFNPNQNTTRREFARWLVAVNNRLYQDQPGRQIRVVSEAAQTAFQDVPRTDPDFPFIQGLAEAGYIPSPLAGETSATRFRPNGPLTREELLLWKVPVDVRRILPSATVATVKQTWGFKDANRISPRTLQAVLADHRNGELSNIRRIFGSTLLFQPQKAVTRAEAVAALGYIGSQGEGFSAQEVLKGERQNSSNTPTATPSSPGNPDQ